MLLYPINAGTATITNTAINAGNIFTTPAENLLILGISGLWCSFASGLSRTSISDGRIVTQPITPKSTPFAITMPRSLPRVKLIKHRAIKPAIVVTELPVTEVSVLDIALAMAFSLSGYFSLHSL